MADLAALLAAAAKHRCSGVTCWPSGTGWQCSVRHADGGWTCHSGSDLVETLAAALSEAIRRYQASEKTTDTSKQPDIFG